MMICVLSVKAKSKCNLCC